jgi:predicted nuclease of predicted toxin-antitoxin system
LLDSCVWGKAKEELIASGHDVVWTGDWTADPGDSAILKRAYEEGRVLVTLDKDFGELAVVFRQAHTGIIRMHKVSARRQAGMVEKILAAHVDELKSGAIVSVNEYRIRVRRPDFPDQGQTV